MNICMIVGHFPPISDGISLYVYFLSKKLVERGHNVTVITRGDWKNACYKEDVDGIRVFRVFYAPLYPFHVNLHGFFLKRKFRILKKEFDIVHFHSPLISSFKTDLPCISTIHGPVKNLIDYKESKDLDSMFNKIFSKIFESLEFNVIKNSNLITTVSNSSKNRINNLYNLPNDMIIINNGVDTNFFTPKKINDKKDNCVLYAGRLDSGKGLIDLITAAKIITGEGKNIKFTLVGKGPLEKYLKQKVNKLGLKKHFNFVGFVTHSKIVEYYQNSTIFVIPSYYEGFPTALLEAMACGIASVATNVEGIPELIKNGQNGLVFPPKKPEILAAAINKLLDDKNLREDMGRNARQHIITNYDWEIITDKFEQTYNLVVSNKEL